MELHDKIGFISQIFNLKRSIVGLLLQGDPLNWKRNWINLTK